MRQGRGGGSAGADAEDREPSECPGLRGGLHWSPAVPVCWSGSHGETCSSGQLSEASGSPPEQEKSNQARTGVVLGAGFWMWPGRMGHVYTDSEGPAITHVESL